MRVIKLENSGITDQLLITLIDSFIQSDKPYVLNELSLALNEITDVGAEKIAAFMEFNGNKLKVLNLHWNKIKFKGGLRLAEALEKN